MRERKTSALKGHIPCYCQNCTAHVLTTHEMSKCYLLEYVIQTVIESPGIMNNSK